MVNFDNLLPHIGEFGRYQKLRFFLLASISGVYFGWAYASMMFIIMPTDHWCNIPPNDALPMKLQNQTKSQLEEMLIPMKLEDTGEYKREKCLMIDPNNFTFADNEAHGSQIPCEFGWTFDPNGKWLLMNEFDLVCSKSYHLNLMMTVRELVGMIGMFLWVNLADIIGRKTVIYISWPLCLLLGIASVLIPSYTGFAVVVSIQSFAGQPLYMTPCVLALELVGPKHHTFIVNITSMIFSIAAASYAVIAYLLHSWKQQILVYQMIFTPLLVLYFLIIDESPRWLLSRGKIDRALKIITKIARINGKTLSKAEIESLVTETELSDMQKDRVHECQHEHLVQDTNTEVPKKKMCTASLLTLFTSTNLALITISIAFLWSVNMLVYLGLAYNIPNFGGNRYLVFAVLAIIEIPASLINFIIDKTGRIWPFSIAFFVTGIGLLVASLVPAKLVGLVVVFVVIAKLCITASFNIVFQVGGELFPTILRTTGCGFAATASRIVGSLAPFVVYSAATFHALPTLIMSAMALAGGVVVFFLPETMNHTLPETVEDTNKGLEVGVMSCLRNIRCQCKSKLENDELDL